MENYWEIITKSGDRIEIPPDAVEVVKRRWDNGEPVHTKTQGSVAANEIKSFRPTSRPYGQQPLLEAAAHALNDPILNDDGSVVARWVKKAVPQREYEKHYSAIPAYHNLGSQNGLVSVAFFLPVHQLDSARLDYCTDEEVQQLTKR